MFYSLDPWVNSSLSLLIYLGNRCLSKIRLMIATQKLHST